MKRLLAPLVLSLVFLASVATASYSQDLVNRAVKAMGGADALNAVKTVSVRGTVRQWEPEQSIVPDGEMRLANDSTFEMLIDVGTRSTRIDWVRNYVYPWTRTYTFSEIITPDTGYVAGIDSIARNKQNLESNPPANAMSGLRLAATQRELRRAPAPLLRDMLRNPDKVSSAGNVTVGGAAYPAVKYRAGDVTYIVMFDSQTSLPARIRTLDYDNVWGDVNYDLVLSDWQMMDGR